MKSLNTFICAIFLCIFCGNAFSATWYTSEDWIMKDASDSAHRFFAIGITSDSVHYGSGTDFTNFNLLSAANCGNYGNYEVGSNMASKVILTGQTWLAWRLRNEGQVSGELDALGYHKNNDNYISYAEMDTIKNISWQTGFKNYILNRVVNQIDSLVVTFHQCPDFIYYMADEPEDNGNDFQSWNWYYETLWTYLHDGIYQKTHDNTSNRIGAIGFGPVEGSRYHYWKNVVVPKIPYPGWNKDTPYPDSMMCSYDGGAPDASKYALNVGKTVSYYRGVANLHLLNSYNAFKNSPKLAGDIVTVIKDSLNVDGYQNNRPVWLWFNALDMADTTSYLKVRCEIYTAITRKCTGVILWAPPSVATTYNMQHARLIAAELNAHQGKYKGTVTNFGTIPAYNSIGSQYLGEMYYATFDSSGTIFCLLTNPDNISGAYVWHNDLHNRGFNYSGTNIYMSGRPYNARLLKENGASYIGKQVLSAKLKDSTDLFGQEDVENTYESEFKNQPIPFTVNVKPNPFNPVTSIDFNLPERGHVSLDVYSLNGQKVATLVNKEMNAGSHRVQFNGENLSSGVYIYRIRSGSHSDTGKMTLMK